jgi:hypothetical protein
LLGSFIITQNGANMQGTFITPVTLRVEKTNTGERILATGSEEFFLLMTVQKSRPPAVKIIGSISFMQVSNYNYS